jgi:hypothetical protein
MKLKLAFLFILCALFTSCNSAYQQPATSGSSSSSTTSSQSSSSSNGVLTTEKAEKAVETWANRARTSSCTGNCLVKLLGGVREIPQQNAAVAELKFTDFIYQPSNEKVERIYSGAGTATFVRYTDRRWVLNEIKIGDIYASTSWKPQIDAN